jgi:hypothetical protein
MEVHYRHLESDPGYRGRVMEIERFIARLLSSPAAYRVRSPIVIPVVLHVVYNTAAENISVSQIKGQIAVLNKDFRAKNADKSKVPPVWRGLITDSGIEFELAKTDPSGRPTSGIRRVRAGRPAFGTDDSVKFGATGGDDAWPADRYLNVWVCQISRDILGYAQFPGGDPRTDGVVLQYTAFGTRGRAMAPFNLGRSATHEIGHWLNLRHIWGDDVAPLSCQGSGFVVDTPHQSNPNYGKPTFPHVSCNNGPNGDMYMNFMDYVDDDSMHMFTAQQVARMRATLEGPRGGIGRT